MNYKNSSRHWHCHALVLSVLPKTNMNLVVPVNKFDVKNYDDVCRISDGNVWLDILRIILMMSGKVNCHY